ncbi:MULTISPECIES: hypothetical protein [Paenibacillus]|uniref:hypothetical protein n=1 Tax=Paenibacillus TaxID=44249 RepID=UPI00096DAB70|nr:hypothetical protein [Paenibacillus odorifer]OME04011.1 hypothetical protein BSK60_33310 [Paenibacillus odorifer]
MKIVQRKMFVNEKESVINTWLSTLSAEDIISVNFSTASFEGNTDEYTAIFFKTTNTESFDNAE